MWLFAFFPGNDVDGVGCIWARTFEADNWIPREHPTASGYPWNAGVVAAAWVSNVRQVRLAIPKPFTPCLLTVGSSGEPMPLSLRIVYR